jgi:hypothetical protein
MFTRSNWGRRIALVFVFIVTAPTFWQASPPAPVGVSCF